MLFDRGHPIFCTQLYLIICFASLQSWAFLGGFFVCFFWQGHFYLNNEGFFFDTCKIVIESNRASHKHYSLWWYDRINLLCNKSVWSLWICSPIQVKTVLFLLSSRSHKTTRSCGKLGEPNELNNLVSKALIIRLQGGLKSSLKYILPFNSGLGSDVSASLFCMGFTRIQQGNTRLYGIMCAGVPRPSTFLIFYL